MSGTNITANDVVNIIEACKGSKVEYIKFDTLEMRFDTNNHPNQHQSNASDKDVVSLNNQDQLNTSPDLFEPNDIKDDELMMAEMADQLNIEDPAQFEQMQLLAMNRGNN